MRSAGTVKRYHSDGAGELMGKEMHAYCQQGEYPTAVTWIVAEHPNLNPLAEGAMWILFSMVRAMLIESGIPGTHWAAALTYATYLYRRMPRKYKTKNPDGKEQRKWSTPYYQLYGEKPSLRHAKLFGCVAQALRSPKDLKSSKLASRVHTGYYMGPARNRVGGTLIWVPGEPKYIVAYSVKTDESRTFKSPSAPHTGIKELPFIPIPTKATETHNNDRHTERPARRKDIPDTTEDVNHRGATRIAIGTRVEVFGEKGKWWPGTINGRKENNDGTYIHNITYDGYKRKYWHDFDDEEWRITGNLGTNPPPSMGLESFTRTQVRRDNCSGP